MLPDADATRLDMHPDQRGLAIRHAVPLHPEDGPKPYKSFPLRCKPAAAGKEGKAKLLRLESRPSLYEQTAEFRKRQVGKIEPPHFWLAKQNDMAYWGPNQYAMPTQPMQPTNNPSHPFVATV